VRKAFEGKIKFLVGRKRNVKEREKTKSEDQSNNVDFGRSGVYRHCDYFVSRGETSGKPVVINNTAVPPILTLRADIVSEGEALYMQYCSEYHGADLKGSPTWKQRLEDGSLPPPPQDDTSHT